MTSVHADRLAPHRRRRRIRSVALTVGWFLIASLVAAATYALLVFGGH